MVCPSTVRPKTARTTRVMRANTRMKISAWLSSPPNLMHGVPVWRAWYTKVGIHAAKVAVPATMAAAVRHAARRGSADWARIARQARRRSATATR